MAWLYADVGSYLSISCYHGFQRPYVGFGLGSIPNISLHFRVSGSFWAPRAFPASNLHLEWCGWMRNWNLICRSRAAMVSKDHTWVWFVDIILRIFTGYPSLQVFRAETLVERFTARFPFF